LLVTIPFEPLRTGSQELPEINIPYYDPASERIESVVLKGVRVEVFNPLWRIAQRVMLGLFAIFAMAGFGYWLFKKLRLGFQKHKSLKAIGAAQNAVELHRALLNFGCAHSVMENHTLQQWLKQMQQTYHVDAHLADVVRKLEMAQYAADKTGFRIPELARESVRFLRGCKIRKA
jgi:hypothetical protein